MGGSPTRFQLRLARAAKLLLVLGAGVAVLLGGTALLVGLAAGRAAAAESPVAAALDCIPVATLVAAPPRWSVPQLASGHLGALAPVAEAPARAGRSTGQ